MLLVSAAPLLFGCQPPWASGFLLAAVIALALPFICLSAWRGRRWAFDSRLLNAAVALLLAWLILTVAHDLRAGAEQGRIPSASLRKLPYAAAFVCAALLGQAYCSSRERLRRALSLFSLCGAILAAFALVQWAGWDVKKLAGWELSHMSDRGPEARPSGLYTNANRFAVMLACCWFCAAAVLADQVWQRVRRKEGDPLAGRPGGRPYFRFGLPSLAMLIIGCAISLTLSRLTMLTVAAAVGLLAFLGALLMARARKDGDESEGGGPRQNAMLLVIPLVIVAGWAAWCLIIGNENLRARFAQLHSDGGLDSRVRVASLAWPLVLQQPWWGHGLGSFESVFTAVQPATLAGRWRELHSDWLQLAFEAGLPALALSLFALAAWCRAVWRTVKSELAPSPYPLPTGERGTTALPLPAGVSGKTAPLLRIVPAAAMVVVALCSLADFPLREPATAILLFFLAGALCASSSASAGDAVDRTAGVSPVVRAEDRRDAGGTLFGWLAPVAAALCVSVLASCAWIAARNSLAYAASPWMGRIYSPDSKPEQCAGWRRACAIDPGDPELHYRLAGAELLSSEMAGGKLDAARLQAAYDEAARAEELQLFDYRFPWRKASAAELLGRFGEADALREKAVALAPANAWMREQSGRLYLREVARDGADDVQRERALQLALGHFRVALQAAPHREAALVGALSGAGCLNSEIAALWPADSEANRIRRARFFCGQGQWDLAERDLRGPEPAGRVERAWYHAVLGTIALRRGESEAGRSAWDLAVGAVGEETGAKGAPAREELDAWLAEQALAFDGAACELLAAGLQRRLAAYPRTAWVLAKTLIEQRRWAAADRLLGTAGHASADLAALGAELALELGDYQAAGIRAREAWEKELSSPRRGSWYDEFRGRLKQRQANGRL